MEKLKNIALFFILSSFILSSCNSKRVHLLKQAIQIQQNYQEKNIKDSREELFRINFSFNNNKITAKGMVEDAAKKEQLLLEFKNSKIDVVDSIRVVPDAVVGEKKWGLINLSCANLRLRPKHSAELATQAIMGTPVKIFDKKESWYLIQTPDKYIAWVDAAGIFPITSQALQQWQKSNRIIIVNDNASIINKNEVVSDVVLGAILEVKKVDKKYFYVQLPDGRLGQIEKTSAVIFDTWKKNTTLSANNIEKTAKQLMGRPYLWGGTSTKAVDCSGFSKTVYFNNGIILARDASLQFAQGDTVLASQGYQALSKGDLVFFGKTTDNQPKATHVGIYLGNGEFIHAAGRVKINSFNPNAKNYSNFRTITWIGGRRFINSKFDTKNISIAHHSWY